VGFLRSMFIGSGVDPTNVDRPITRSQGVRNHRLAHRMDKATKVFRGLKSVWKARLSLGTKGMVYCALVRSIQLAAAGTWTTSTADMRRFETWEARLGEQPCHLYSFWTRGRTALTWLLPPLRTLKCAPRSSSVARQC